MDRQLRLLERQLAAFPSWETKLQYNVLSIRNGIIPPPDIEIEGTWSEEKVEEYATPGRWGRNAGIPKWMPQVGMRRHWFRRWFFPNFLGVSVAYDMDNPWPGMAPIPTAMAPEDHEVDCTVFSWDYNNVASSERNFARLHDPRIIIWPDWPIPDIKRYFDRVTPRFKIGDDDSLLELLTLAAVAPAVRVGVRYDQDQIWQGTDYAYRQIHLEQ